MDFGTLGSFDFAEFDRVHFEIGPGLWDFSTLGMCETWTCGILDFGTLVFWDFGRFGLVGTLGLSRVHRFFVSCVEEAAGHRFWSGGWFPWELGPADAATTH